jgi:hypothetical protein
MQGFERFAFRFDFFLTSLPVISLEEHKVPSGHADAHWSAKHFSKIGFDVGSEWTVCNYESITTLLAKPK